MTEFGCQGLELDATLLAWGRDFVIENGGWSNRLAKRYQAPAKIRDALQLRTNAYRVLLTRARQGMVIYVPQPTRADASRLHNDLDATAEFLISCGAELI